MYSICFDKLNEDLKTTETIKVATASTFELAVETLKMYESRDCMTEYYIEKEKEL